MKLARFSRDRSQEIGIVTDGKIVSVSSERPGLVHGMLDLIARWDEVRPELESLSEAQSVSLDDVQLLAPVDRPSKILAIGLNYADHIAETGLATPEHQLWFGKTPNTIHAPFADVQIPRASEMIDYEVELVAVIGKGGRHISSEDAPAAVFGYCVGNDVSVRDWQMRTPQWLLGKSFDTHAPIGPWVTTADELGDPHRLDITCRVNGELRQNSNTKHLLFKVWDQIAHLSEAMTLVPGDIIFTGTPGGIGWSMEPRSMLKAGDRVRCEIAELGAIECQMAAE